MDEEFWKFEVLKVKKHFWMDVNDFSSYSAKVGEGSGVLFSTMNKRDYTYILT